jgi:hypothetical protein
MFCSTVSEAHSSISLVTAVEDVQKGFSSGLSMPNFLSGGFSSSGKPFHHEPNHPEIHQTFATACQVLIVLIHPSIPSNPREGALDNPVILPRKLFSVSECLPSFFPFVIRWYDISIRGVRQVAHRSSGGGGRPQSRAGVLPEAFLLCLVGQQDPAVQGLIGTDNKEILDPTVL